MLERLMSLHILSVSMCFEHSLPRARIFAHARAI